jgi:5-(carboxyamino)imidazole ribonucleotide synthase
MGKRFYQDLRLGILGGGQLGRMFVAACQRFNVHTSVLDTAQGGGPARSVAQRFVEGDFTRYEDVVAFGRSVDVLTIEIENVNVAALRHLQQHGVEVYPQPDVIETVQDKGLQKQFYQANDVPTAAFELLDSGRQLQAQFAQNAFHPRVLKLRRGGYDGQGVQIMHKPDDLANAFDAPCVAESLVDIQKEISVVVARNTHGQLIAYPPVEMEFHPTAHLVEFLFCPASLTTKEVQAVQTTAVHVAERLGIVGLLAVEMFITPTGNIVVNEMAPRPHNSGHHTQEAAITSQFEQHLRAILGLPLGSTAVKIPAVMVNLLGEPGHSGPPVYQGVEEVLRYPGVSINLYGKHQTRPYRKMGHVTITDRDLDAAKEKARLVKRTLKVISQQ